MAEIDVRRRGPRIWPWILGLLALGLLIWATVEWTQRERAAVRAAPDRVAVESEIPAEPDRPLVGAAIQPAVEEYLHRCADREETPEETGPDHEFAATCIRILSGALASVIGRDTVGNVPLQRMLAGYRQAARRVQESDWESPRHGDLVRAVFASAADLMEHVEQTRPGTPPELRERITEVRRAAQAVEPGTPLEEQREETDTFFRSAGGAIDLMAERDPPPPRNR